MIAKRLHALDLVNQLDCTIAVICIAGFTCHVVMVGLVTRAMDAEVPGASMQEMISAMDEGAMQGWHGRPAWSMNAR